MGEINTKSTACIQRAAELTGIDLVLPEALNAEKPLQVVVMGQPQQNLFGVLQEQYGGFQALNRTFLRGFLCSITYGEQNKVTVLHGEERLESTDEGLANLLSKFEHSGAPVVCEIERNCPQLRDVQFRLIASDHDFEEIDWVEVVTQADYCFFTLTSTALLSMCERRALRTQLLPTMKQALSVILTNDHLILEEDRGDIQASLDKFFQNEVSFFRSPVDGDDTLARKVAELAGQLASLRTLRQARTEKLLLGKALKEIELQTEVLTSDSDRIEEALEFMREKTKALPARQESACRRARMHYTSRMKVEVSEQISSFHSRLMKQVTTEIQQGENVEEMREILPAYIADLWDEEAQRIQKNVQESVDAMQLDLNAYVEKDIRSYLESGADGDLANYVFRLTDLYTDTDFVSDKGAFSARKLKDNSKLKKYGVIASGVAMILMSHPIIGVSVAVFGSKRIQEDEKARFLHSSRETLTEAAAEMSRSIHDDMVVWMDQTITAVEANLTMNVETCYQKIMDAMVQALNNRKLDQDSHKEQLDALTTLKADIEYMMKV